MEVFLDILNKYWSWRNADILVTHKGHTIQEVGDNKYVARAWWGLMYRGYLCNSGDYFIWSRNTGLHVRMTETQMTNKYGMIRKKRRLLGLF